MILLPTNCTSFVKIQNTIQNPTMQHILIIFFPPQNTTVVVQILDPCMIKNLKYYYRERIVLSLLRNFKVGIKKDIN